MNFDKPMYEFFNDAYIDKKEKTGGDRLGILGRWGEHRKYIKTCLDNNQDLSLDPQVVLSTIHKMKGGEEDNVLAIAEMEQPRYSAYTSGDVEREDDVAVLFLDFYINEETFRQNKKENIFYGMLMDYFASGINIGEEINSNTYDYVLEQMIYSLNNSSLWLGLISPEGY